MKITLCSPQFKSIVISSFKAFESCKAKYCQEGYEIKPDANVRSDLAYVIDNNGNISVAQILDLTHGVKDR